MRGSSNRPFDAGNLCDIPLHIFGLYAVERAVCVGFRTMRTVAGARLGIGSSRPVFPVLCSLLAGGTHDTSRFDPCCAIHSSVRDSESSTTRSVSESSPSSPLGLGSGPEIHEREPRPSIERCGSGRVTVDGDVVNNSVHGEQGRDVRHEQLETFESLIGSVSPAL